MKRTVVLFTAIFLTCFFVSSAKAGLFDRGRGLIYDDILDITWLQNANYTGSTMMWDDAAGWADDLSFQGYDDWRLPASDASCSGYGCTGSEMGHLYYMEGVNSDSAGLFTDVQLYMYWSGTDYDGDNTKAWRFRFSTGYQGTSLKTYKRYAWAVRDGDSPPPVLPEPAASVLFIAGGLSLAGRLWNK